MAWSTSNRRSELPPDWHKIRARILRRDRNACRWKMADGSRCGDLASDVDHISPGGDHSENNLRSLCDWHHKRKSSQEGGQAMAVKKKKISRSFKAIEAHPGALR